MLYLGRAQFLQQPVGNGLLFRFRALRRVLSKTKPECSIIHGERTTCMWLSDSVLNRFSSSSSLKFRWRS